MPAVAILAAPAKVSEVAAIMEVAGVSSFSSVLKVILNGLTAAETD